MPTTKTRLMDVHLDEHNLLYNKDLDKVSVMQLVRDLSFLLRIKTNASNHLSIQMQPH